MCSIRVFRRFPALTFASRKEEISFPGRNEKHKPCDDLLENRQRKILSTPTMVDSFGSRFVVLLVFRLQF